MRRSFESVSFWTLAVVAAGLLVLLGGVLSGRFVSEPESEAERAPVLAVAAETTAVSTPTQAAKPVAAEPAATVVVLRATRGDCWVEARAGGPEGRQVAFRLLARGQTLRLSAKRIWLSLGAAQNVDVTVNGKRRPLGDAVTSVLLG